MSDYKRRPGDDIVEPLFGALSGEDAASKAPLDRSLIAACLAVAVVLWWFLS